MFLIVGCGRLGANLSIRLSEAGHEVMVVDHIRQHIENNLPQDFAGRVIVGLEVDREVLKRAGIEKAKVFVAVSRDENTNMMAADLARKVFNVPRIVVRIDQPLLAEHYQLLGYEVISPVSDATLALERAILDTPELI